MADPGTSNHALVLNGVRKRYGARAVLDGVDLPIPTGAVYGLIGRNGAGKSTLLKCALGLIRSFEGTISTLGEDPRELSARAKARIGYAPQTPTLYPWMRVAAQLDYSAAYYPAWDNVLVQRLLREWEIDPQALIATLSPGQAQRVGIVLAIGHRPDLVVLDEPVSALDPAARRRFLATVLEIALDGGRTVLFSTHLTSDLERVADSVAVLKDGRIVFAGELAELKDSVKRLRMDGPLRSRLDGVEILSQRGEDGRVSLSVRGDIATAVKGLGARVEIDDLDLEDIFLTLHGE